jgi:hypothetical protein
VSGVRVALGAGIRELERTLLTTGVLDRCMQLLAAGGGHTETPELTFGYAGGDWVFANHPKSRLQVPYE